MRILIASDFYPPSIGGAERQVELLGAALARGGHEVSIATIRQGGSPTHEVHNGVNLYRLDGLTTRVPWFSSNPGRRFHPPLPDPGVVWSLRRLIDRAKPDVVNANGWIAYSCAAALTGRATPLIVSVRDYGYTCAKRTMLFDGRVCDGPAPLKCLGCATNVYGAPKASVAVASVFGWRPLLRRTIGGAHSVSTYVKRVVHRDLLYGRPGGTGPIELVIPDIAITDTTLSAPSSSLEADPYADSLPDEPFILFVGALQPHKGLAPLLAAHRRLASPPPPLVLIGTVWADTPKEFPSGATVLRNMPHPSVMNAWRRSLFGVAPSIWPDPLPGVVREAMSQARPVVATNVGGNPDMIQHEETGLLVPPGDVDALAAAMQRLIDDPGLRTRMGRLAQERVRALTGEVVASQFEALYQQVQSSRLGASR